MRGHSEQRSCPRRKNPATIKTRSGCCQTERSGKVFWDAEQSDRHLAGCWNSCVAGKALCPREARMRPLPSGEDHFRRVRQSGGLRRLTHLDALVSHQLLTSAPVFPAAPVAPEQRCGTHPKRMEKHTHLPWLCGSLAIPLALLTQWTGTATALLAPYTTRRLPSASRR